jgi:VanZ family protein
MAFLQNPRFQLLMRIAFWLALIFAVIMAELPQPPEMPTDDLGDKWNHMIAFATLAFFAALGFPAAIRWRVAERLSFLGALIELVQSIPVLERQCDITDWMADTAAIVVVTAVMAWLLARLRPKVAPAE